MKKVLLVVLLSLFVCGVAHAANLSGVWRGELQCFDEMTLKQTGNKIQGSSYYPVDMRCYNYSIKGSVKKNKVSFTFKTLNYDCVLYFNGDINGDILSLTFTSKEGEGSECYFQSDSIEFMRLYTCD